VVTAPLRLRLWDGKFREPDIVFLLAQHADRRGNNYWRGADLVMEVVSEDDPDRDLVTKRVEYAQAGICEYWLLDPRDRTVTVLALDAAAGEYSVAGRYAQSETARSVLLDGFSFEGRGSFRRWAGKDTVPILFGTLLARAGILAARRRVVQVT